MPAPRVLLVAEAAEHRERLRRTLRDLPLELQEAAGAAAASTALDRQRFDVVLCEHGMAGAGGLEVLRALRQRKLPPHSSS